MFFTQEDYLKIEKWLKTRAIKDSQFDIVDSINGITDYDYFVFLQNGENKRIKVSNLLSGISDYINVTKKFNKEQLTFSEAIDFIPSEERKGGMTITYKNRENQWEIYQYRGTSLLDSDWNNRNNWVYVGEDIIVQELGDKTNRTISQKAVTNSLNNLNNTIFIEKNKLQDYLVEDYTKKINSVNYRINDLNKSQSFFRSGGYEIQNITSYFNKEHTEWTLESGYTQNLDLSNQIGSRVRGSYNVLIGGSNTTDIKGSFNFTIGSNISNINNNYNYIFGRSIKNDGNNNIIIGKGHEITNSHWNTIIGNDDISFNSNHKYIFGRGLDANNYEYPQWLFGQYNKNTDSAFAFGYGSNDDNRKNLFEITDTGEVLMLGLFQQTELGSLQQWLQAYAKYLALKQDQLTAGTGISISNDNIITCTLDPTIFIVIDSLPTTPLDANINKIHLVKDTTVTGNLYSEYLWVNNAWEKLGDFQPTIDLSDYAKTADIPIEKGSGENSVVQKGGGNTASGVRAVAIGTGNHARGVSSFAEGELTDATGNSSHSEGYQTNSTGYASHSEGSNNTASGSSSHAEGYHTTASGEASHSEGIDTEATNNSAHAEGYKTHAARYQSHAEGNQTLADGVASHAEGFKTTTTNKGEHAEGLSNLSIQGKTIHTVGIGSADDNVDDKLNAEEIHLNGDKYIFGIGGYDGTNSETGGIKTVQEVVNDKLDKIIETTWSELKDLRDNNKLIPGQQYRITDYVTTSTQTYTKSAGHQFDIIVIADSTNKLNCKARAALHSEDTYFANSALDKWELWYCLDNDTTKYAWADSDNGKGVIYRMIDEFNNDIPYDFKNIQFKHPINTTAYPYYYYTFASGNTEANTDYSLDISKNCYGNSIKPYIMNFLRRLNRTIFIGNDCNRNTFGNDCYNNAFGNDCNRNTFGNNYISNAFGNGCGYNTFGNSCGYNTFGNNCTYIKFASDSSATTKYTYYQYNHFGDGCKYIAFTGKETAGSSLQVQNYKFAQGLQGTSSSYLTIDGVRNRVFETKVAKNSNGDVKMYCEADLIL